MSSLTYILGFSVRFFVNQTQAHPTESLVSEIYPMTLPANQDGHHSQTYIGSYGKLFQKSSCLKQLDQFENFIF